MRIERIRIQEGFLDGLELEFAVGLNVLIGERGTGKTSVIELLRYCLDAESFTEDGRSRGAQQARAVLGDGVVFVDVDDDGDRFSLSRTSSEQPPERRAASHVTVLAQNEVEAVGAQAAGRLRLLDRFRVDRTPEDSAPALVARIRALTAEIHGVLAERDSIDERVAALAEVPAQLESALAEQSTALTNVEATEDQRRQLANYQQIYGRLSVRTEVFDDARSRLSRYSEAVEQLRRSRLTLEAWPDAAGADDQLATVRAALDKLAHDVESLDSGLNSVTADVEALATANEATRASVESEARELRAALNRLQEGIGAVTRRVDELRERKGQLDALAELRKARQEQLVELKRERDAGYRELDTLRDRRFEDRSRVATMLNSELGPQIRVTLRRSASTAAYIRELINGLRGSGLHYNQLAPRLAADLSPLELVTAAEDFDVEAVVTRTDLSPDRASTLLQQLREEATTDLVTVPIDDGVLMELLDGTDYKATDKLSIGQRCTVVLPILLNRRDAVLIVDQPEDHLDNAFVTSTLVSRLRARGPSDQMIFSSHNPNIPVLGEADQVVVMGSNGSRGYKLHQGALNEPKTVGFITSLMEGGAEAFRLRAEFYGRSAEQ